MQGNKLLLALAAILLLAPCARGDATLTTLVSIGDLGAHDARPFGGLIQGFDGSLFGTGVHLSGGNGFVFEVTTDGPLTEYPVLSGTFVVSSSTKPVQRKHDGSLYAFFGNFLTRIGTNGTQTLQVPVPLTVGTSPSALVEGSDGNFYGTTQYSTNNSNWGTVFQTTFNGRFTVLHTFTNGNDGASPSASAGLIQASDGNFYGTTQQGGWNNAGTVFKITTNGTLTIIYAFHGDDDGFNPQGALVQGIDGYLYGTTASGGTNGFEYDGYGTIFKISTAGAFTTLCSFAGTNGSSPFAALIRGNDGGFFGTTAYGGTTSLAFPTEGFGTIFRMSTNGELTTLISFNGTNGVKPMSSLVQSKDGNLYGTTLYGGAGFNGNKSSGHGTVFQLSLQPTIQVTAATNGLAFCWNAVPGLNYQVQCRTNWNQTNWIALGASVTATNGTMTASDTIPSGPSQRWYRVALLP